VWGRGTIDGYESGKLFSTQGAAITKGPLIIELGERA
jgi:hypothetical protein